MQHLPHLLAATAYCNGIHAIVHVSLSFFSIGVVVGYPLALRLLIWLKATVYFAQLSIAFQRPLSCAILRQGKNSPWRFAKFIFAPPCNIALTAIGITMALYCCWCCVVGVSAVCPSHLRLQICRILTVPCHNHIFLIVVVVHLYFLCALISAHCEYFCCCHVLFWPRCDCLGCVALVLGCTLLKIFVIAFFFVVAVVEALTSLFSSNSQQLGYLWFMSQLGFFMKNGFLLFFNRLRTLFSFTDRLFNRVRVVDSQSPLLSPVRRPVWASVLCRRFLLKCRRTATLQQQHQGIRTPMFASLTSYRHRVSLLLWLLLNSIDGGM